MANVSVYTYTNDNAQPTANTFQVEIVADNNTDVTYSLTNNNSTPFGSGSAPLSGLKWRSWQSGTSLFDASESDMENMLATPSQFHTPDIEQPFMAQFAELIRTTSGSTPNVAALAEDAAAAAAAPGASWAVSYGFCDVQSVSPDSSSSPFQGFQDQLYVYVTKSHENWMGTLMLDNPGLLQKPFGSFVLPGAHDAGMCDPGMLNAVLENSGWIVAACQFAAAQMPSSSSSSSTIKSLLGNMNSDMANKIANLAEVFNLGMARQILVNFAFGQKDDITTMLNLGIRYFDFRPGYCAGGQVTPTALYHQHAIVPGYPYINFLEDVLTWLNAHPTEIVVVNLRSSEIPTAGVPSGAALQSAWGAANGNGVGHAFYYKSSTDKTITLGQSYQTLISSNTRLIFLFTDRSSDPADGFPDSSAFGPALPGPANDSYTNSDYEVLQANMTTETSVWNAIADAAGGSAPFTLLDLQATATAAPNGNDFAFDSVVGLATAQSLISKASDVIGLASSILGIDPSYSKAGSPLMYTKGGLDGQNYKNLPSLTSKFPVNQLVCCMNDFADNALVDVCIGMTLSRLNAAS